MAGFFEDEQAWHCEEGDHRCCVVADWAWSAKWWPLLSVAAVAAFAVLSTIDGDQPVLLRCFDRLQQAKPFRTAYGRRRGLSTVPLHDLVPVLDDQGRYA
jgi:hypothetical protein